MPAVGPSSPIAIFDSGPGGLAVLQEVKRLLPHEEVLYFGDTARQPYGPQSIEAVRRYAVEITAWLIEKGAKLVMIGCNTASVAGRQAAQERFPLTPVLGMIEPAVRAALQGSAADNRIDGSARRIGVWGTEITVASKAYDKAFLEADPSVQVFGQDCPALLRLAEKGRIEDKALLKELAERYYQPLAENDIETLVLGCTDLTCVRDVIDEVAGVEVRVIDPAEAIVQEAAALLAERNLLSPGRDKPDGQCMPTTSFYISGQNKAEFAAFTAQFMNLSQVPVQIVPVPEIQGALEAAAHHPRPGFS